MTDPRVPAAAPAALPRALGGTGVLLLTLSATTPASSLFVIVPGAVQVAGTGALWAFLLAGLVCVATAFVYAELSSAFPVAGGEYVMVARTLGPLPGFVILGVNVFNNVLFPPVLGLGTSAVLSAVAPGLPPVPVAIAVVAGSTLVALLDIRANAVATGLFLAAEMAALGVVALAGLARPARPLAVLLLHPVAPGGVAAGPASIGIATAIAIFALNGYGMAVYFGEEMRDASRRIARVVLACFVVAFVLEVVPLAAGLAGADDLPDLLAAEDPFGGLVAARVGGGIAQAVALGVAVAIVNAAIVTVLASARFLYATARDGVWGGPVDRALGRVGSRSGVPWVATLAVGGVGVACCFVSLPFLLVLNGAGLVATYLAISLAAIAGRRKGATAGASYRMPLFPLAPAVTVLALGYVAWVSWGDPQEGRPGIVATAAQMAGAVAYYLAVVRRRGPWVVHDPPREGEGGA